MYLVVVETLATIAGYSLMRSGKPIALSLAPLAPLFLTWNLIVPLLTVWADNDQPPDPLPGVKVTLSISVNEYDPSVLSATTIKCIVENKSKQPIVVPIGYDGQVVRLCGKAPSMNWSETMRIDLWHPGLTPGGGRPEMISKPPKLDSQQVLPGQQQVVFEFPLDAVLLNRGFPKTDMSINKDWYWDWPARSTPPRTPINLPGRGDLAEKTALWATVAVGGKSLSSEETTLKVQSTESKKPNAPGLPANTEAKARQTKRIPLDQLPLRLVAAVKKQFPKGEILRAKQTPYTPAMMDCEDWGVRVKDAQQEFDVGVLSISGSYQVNDIAKSIAVGDVPKPVTAALNLKYPQATIKSAREVLNGLISLPPGKSKPPDYELTIVTADKESLVVNFTPERTKNAKGEEQRNPEKMVFAWESPIDDGKK